jgi:hypothetical protein
MAFNIPKDHREKAARKSGVKHEALWQRKQIREDMLFEKEKREEEFRKKQQLPKPMPGATMVSGRGITPAKKQPAGKKGKLV